MKKTYIILAAALLFSGVQAGDWGKAPIKNPISYDCNSPWRFSAEALYLKAHGDMDAPDHEFGYRFELSYQGDGIGIRGRWFEFTGNEAFFSADHPEISALDIELFDQFELGPWMGEYSFGARNGNWHEVDRPGPLNEDFEGWGPTVAFELTRPLAGPWSLYTGARISHLFGNEQRTNEHLSVTATEIFGGIEYAIGDCGSRVRFGVEAQNWSNVVDTNEDIGLFGGVVEVQLAF